MQRSEIWRRRKGREEPEVPGKRWWEVSSLQQVRNNFAVIFEDEQKKQISASSLSYVREKEEVGKKVDETIFALTKREQGKLLTIDDDPVWEGDGTPVK